MKFPLLALFLCCATVWADEPDRTSEPSGTPTASAATAASAARPASSERPPIERCFQIHWLLKVDDAHYWADWINTCPYTIDAVYVMVGFLDHDKNHMGNGVWPMYFVLPGAHQVTRFSAPAEVSGFETMTVHRVTIDTAEAFSQDRNTVQSVHARASAGTGDSGYGRVIRAESK